MTTVTRMEASKGIPVAVDTLEAFRSSVGVGISIRGVGGGWRTGILFTAPSIFVGLLLRPEKSLLLHHRVHLLGVSLAISFGHTLGHNPQFKIPNPTPELNIQNP